MSAVAGQERFFVDESALGLGKALAIARKDVIHTGHGLIPEIPLGTLDPDWMSAVAARDLIVIARDRHIRTKPVELRAYQALGLRALWLAGKRDLSTWDYLRLVVRQWDQIEDRARTLGSGPWFVALGESGLRELTV